MYIDRGSIPNDGTRDIEKMKLLQVRPVNKNTGASLTMYICP
jgi:hypothetical protein